METKKIIEQLITTEAWLNGARKEVVRTRKMLENVNSPASGLRGTKEEAAEIVARNMTRKRKRA
jgi:hypothetical protein